ncbi:MAG TPA: gluconate 2-dehydrogenase subunit 3 family protein [Flavisolibacter sp.]|nr:gluconate 2-dehydrogenase subunit 3 family protein [Flavisolibacter sp.]
MERREAVKYISLLLGGAVVGASSFLTGCKSKTGEAKSFSPEQIACLDEIAETILPATSTPGAKAARVGQFMTVMINDCYEASDQQTFMDGMRNINEESEKRFGKDFMSSTPQQRTELLTALDREARDHQHKLNDFNAKEDQKEKEEIARGNTKYVKNRMSPHYFSMMKQLTLLGYFTSEVGAKQALRHNPVPGRFEGCIPYKKGDRAWA